MEKYSIKKQWEMVWDEAIEGYQDTLPKGPEKHQPCPGTSFLDH